jgi:hypothetical protein
MATAMRSRLRNREVSERKQVGDTESMVTGTENVARGLGDDEMM